MKIIIKLIIVFIAILGVDASIVHAINGCPNSNHNRGNGEIIKHGSCISRKNSQGVVIYHTRSLYTSGTTHANCNGIVDETVHCSLKNTTVQKGTYHYSATDTACSGPGTPSSVQSFVLKRLSITSCNYKLDEDDGGE